MRYVNYYRVSTARQGISGLGLDAQRESIRRFLHGKDAEVIGEFTEVETGKSSTRTQLNLAIQLCLKMKATLLIANLSRLARNLHFVTTLQSTGVQFVAVDNPTATPLVIHILCAIAEAEAHTTAERTRLALQQAKLRGIKLGAKNPHLTLPMARQAIQERKQRFNQNTLKVIAEIKAAGVTSLSGIADCLAKRGERTSRGKTIWTATAVARIVNEHTICA
jgi:DNA invertase Pin-like site-specific DNA recombinase